jgi:hypothetical protein
LVAARRLGRRASGIGRWRRTLQRRRGTEGRSRHGRWLARPSFLGGLGWRRAHFLQAFLELANLVD